MQQQKSTTFLITYIGRIITRTTDDKNNKEKISSVTDYN